MKWQFEQRIWTRQTGWNISKVNMLQNVMHLPSDVLKAPGFDSSAPVWRSGQSTTSHRRQGDTGGVWLLLENCLKYTNVQKNKALYIDPLLHPRDSPWDETSVKEVDQILTWQFRNKKDQGTKPIGLPVFIQWAQVPKFTSEGQWCHFTNYGPAHLTSMCLKKTEDYQLTGVNN